MEKARAESRETIHLLADVTLKLTDATEHLRQALEDSAERLDDDDD